MTANQNNSVTNNVSLNNINSKLVELNQKINQETNIAEIQKINQEINQLEAQKKAVESSVSPTSLPTNILATPTPIPTPIPTPTLTPIPPQNIVPPAPTGLVANEVNATSFLLSWTGVDGANSYKVYKNGIPMEANIKNSFFTFKGLIPASTYQITVSVLNSAGESNQSEVLKVSTPSNKPETTESKAPTLTAPTNLVTTEITSSRVALNWDTVNNATSYTVYRDGALIANGVTERPLYITDLNPGTTYTFKVKAVNSIGESEWSSTHSVNTLPLTLAAPTNLVTTEITSSRVALNWDTVNNATSYTVYRDGALIANGVTERPLYITDLNPGTTYTFKVKAVNSMSESEWSSTHSVKTLP